MFLYIYIRGIYKYLINKILIYKKLDKLFCILFYDRKIFEISTYKQIIYFCKLSYKK